MLPPIDPRWHPLLKRLRRHDLLNGVAHSLLFSQWKTPQGVERRWHLLVYDEGQFDVVPVLAQTFLTSPTGSNQTYTSDATWNNNNNTIDAIGAGASGCASSSAAFIHATGGGAGAWNQISNFTFASPGTTTATFQLGTGGAAVVKTAGSGTSSGNNGGDTWFNDTAFPTTGSNKIGAKGGVGGVGGTGSQNGGAGGASASNYPVGGNSGGRGGNLTGASGSGDSGGGGAAGPNGVGNNGGDSTSTSNGISTAGGSADAGSGGAAGAAGGNNPGGNGTEYDASHGSGGGGGGADATGGGDVTAGSGGKYGGGGGGCRAGSTHVGTSGAGGDGIIVLTWTPVLIAGFARRVIYRRNY